MQNIYLFYGADQEALQAELSKWRKAFIQKHTETNLSIFQDDKPNLADILNEAKTLPFLAENRLIIAYNLYLKLDDFEKFLEELKQIPESTIFILVEQETIRKNAKILKQISQTKHFDKSLGSLKKKAQDFLNKHGKKINSFDLDDLILSVSEDPYRLQNELRKLILLNDSEQITKQDIEAIVSLDSNLSVFKLMDNLTDKRLKQSLQNLSTLHDAGEDLVKIFYLLARQIRILLQIKSLSDQGANPKQIAQKTNLKPFIVSKTLKQANSFELNQLFKLLKILLNIDTKLKTGDVKYTKENPKEFLFEIEKFLMQASR